MKSKFPHTTELMTPLEFACLLGIVTLLLIGLAKGAMYYGVIHPMVPLVQSK